jgi:hypothetical protein
MKALPLALLGLLLSFAGCTGGSTLPTVTNGSAARVVPAGCPTDSGGVMTGDCARNRGRASR